MGPKLPFSTWLLSDLCWTNPTLWCWWALADLAGHRTLIPILLGFEGFACWRWKSKISPGSWLTFLCWLPQIPQRNPVDAPALESRLKFPGMKHKTHSSERCPFILFCLLTEEFDVTPFIFHFNSLMSSPQSALHNCR